MKLIRFPVCWIPTLRVRPLSNDPLRRLQIGDLDADTERAEPLFPYPGSEWAVLVHGFEENKSSLSALNLPALFAERPEVALTSRNEAESLGLS